MHINEGKDKLALFSTKYNVLLTPLPFQFYCPLQFFYSLLHNFIIFPPQCFYSLLHNFYYFPSSMFFIPLLHLHLLIYSIYFSIHKYIDLLATLHRPHIDPTSIPHRPYIAPTSTPHQPYIDPTSTPHRPHIDPRLTFFKHSLVNSEYIQPPPHFSLQNFFIPSSTILLFFLFNVFIPSSTFLLATLSLGGR